MRTTPSTITVTTSSPIPHSTSALIGSRPGRQPAEVPAAERARTAERGGLEHFGCRGRKEVMAHDLAEVGRDPHLHDEVTRIRVTAQGEVDAGRAILLPGVEITRTARDVHWAMRDGHAVAAHQLEVTASGVV